MIQLFSHQQKALDLTATHNRCAYYLDMGLGKTFVGSEKLKALNTQINIVVCQHSKISDWIEHFKAHYPDYAVVDMTVKGGIQTVLEWRFGMPVIGVINYELTFRRRTLKSLNGFTLMLDESSLIQNENAKRSKFILGLNPSNVILLSGTPTGGKYEKLWSQCHLLGWNISKELFWRQYVETEWVQEDGFWRQKVIGYKNVDRLKQKLAEYGAIFMTTDDAGIDLPSKNMIQVKMPPAPEYREFWKEWAVWIGDRELIGDTSLTRRLYARQLCGLYNKARYEVFLDLVDSTDDRLIVFYNFTEEMERMREIVQERNRPVSIINGKIKDKSAYYNKSNSITFIQYQAGARGGDHQLANKTIYFSLPQEWELWEQSQKRIHRIGQERPCFYYLLICPGTVEEDVLATLEMRKDYNDELFRKYETQN